MRNSFKHVLALFGFVMGLGSGVSSAASGVGPYYATPSWDQTLPASTRFVILTNMNSETVLDRETGLVWEATPSATQQTWNDAQTHCIDLNAGGRTGWRLPTIQELLSIVDRSNSGVGLPSGAPFNVLLSFFWSATTLAADSTFARSVILVSGQAGIFRKSDAALAWCVRGGQGPDAQ